MKKLFISIVVFLLTFSTVLAQVKASENTLSFSGVPINGTKTQMIRSLTAKGFVYSELFDHLTGMFNGEEVTLRISTNHGVVDRISVEYPYCTEDNDTRIKYNMLLSRFNRSTKYVCTNPRTEVPAGERIYSKLHDNSKYYDSVYFFLSPNIDPEQWVKEYKEEYLKRYTRPLVAGLSYEEMEEALFCLPSKLSDAVSGVVWFTMVNEHRININYINFKNRPRGEDL